MRELLCINADLTSVSMLVKTPASLSLYLPVKPKEDAQRKAEARHIITSTTASAS